MRKQSFRECGTCCRPYRKSEVQLQSRPRPFGASQVLPVSKFSPPSWWAVRCCFCYSGFNAGFTDLLVCSLMKPRNLEPVCAQRSGWPWKMSWDSVYKALSRKERGLQAQAWNQAIHKLGDQEAVVCPLQISVPPQEKGDTASLVRWL